MVFLSPLSLAAFHAWIMHSSADDKGIDADVVALVQDAVAIRLGLSVERDEVNAGRDTEVVEQAGDGGAVWQLKGSLAPCGGGQVLAKTREQFDINVHSSKSIRPEPGVRYARELPDYTRKGHGWQAGGAGVASVDGPTAG